jgi:hypothetical protein
MPRVNEESAGKFHNALAVNFMLCATGWVRRKFLEKAAMGKAPEDWTWPEAAYARHYLNSEGRDQYLSP